MEKSKELKRIKIVLFFMCLLFLSLIVYLTYFQIFKAEEVKLSSFNKRLWINEERTKRGTIEDRNGLALAESVKADKGYKRQYNYNSLYSHLIGYSYREYGKVGLELEYNNTLLNLSENLSLNEIKNLVSTEPVGNSLRLTVDHELQAYSKEVLNGRKGSVIAMNPKSGEIYSMVSLPDFPVSELKEKWNTIIENSDGPLLNRSTSGLYPPGSTFKILTSVGLLEDGGLNKDYNCKGSTIIDGYEMKDYSKSPHGDISLKDALTKSCNVYFADKSQELGRNNFNRLLDKALIGKKIPFDLPTSESKLISGNEMTKTELAAASIGQGKLLLTPLNMALITSGIANKGQIVKPVLVKNIISPRNNIIKTASVESLQKLTNEAIADEIKDMMVNVVENGTGKNAQIPGILVGGKTGTAENASGKSHSWFTGFAPAEDPQVVVTVILEEDGNTGGKTAAPIARDVIKKVLNTIER